MAAEIDTDITTPMTDERFHAIETRAQRAPVLAGSWDPLEYECEGVRFAADDEEIPCPCSKASGTYKDCLGPNVIMGAYVHGLLSVDCGDFTGLTDEAAAFHAVARTDVLALVAEVRRLLADENKREARNA